MTEIPAGLVWQVPSVPILPTGHADANVVNQAPLVEYMLEGQEYEIPATISLSAAMGKHPPAVFLDGAN
jgi:hypothetical protein